MFGPQEGEEFFRRYGWQPMESRSLLKTAAALSRLSRQVMELASMPEPEGPKGEGPWSGMCLFENSASAAWRPSFVVRSARNVDPTPLRLRATSR
jgi:hypothetical protein